MLTSDILYGFSKIFLWGSYDAVKKTPEFHKEMWEASCSDDPFVAMAAPRGHAKSTSVSFAYVLASILFRELEFALIISSTEKMASSFLGTIKAEIATNVELQELFEIRGFTKDTETELIIMFDDGTEAAIYARGWTGKIRGIKWGNKRPDLVLCDDMEDDEAVENIDRREKFRNTFYSVIIPCLSDKGKIRLVGTILHFDSLLQRLMDDTSWTSLFYEAHNKEFTEILWPEKFPRERLERIRESYRSQGIPEKYSQEFLNNPIDIENSYFKKADFRPLKDEDRDQYVEYYAAIDFAISKADRADYTVIAICGLERNGYLQVRDIRKGRWDGKEIIDQMIEVHQLYNPAIFTVEKGMIEKSLGPFLEEEMLRRGVFLNLNPLQPVKDKQTRARGIQARMRTNTVKFDKDAPWYHELEAEMIQFPSGKHDDQVDALSWVGLTLNKLTEPMSHSEVLDSEWDDEFEDTLTPFGIDKVCGY